MFRQTVPDIKHQFKRTTFLRFIQKLINTRQARLTVTSAAAAGYSQTSDQPDSQTPNETGTWNPIHSPAPSGLGLETRARGSLEGCLPRLEEEAKLESMRFAAEQSSADQKAAAQRTIKTTYNATSVEELSLHKGDKVHQIQLDPTGWCNVVRDSAGPVTGKTCGWVPKWMMQSPHSELTAPNETWLI